MKVDDDPGIILLKCDLELVLLDTWSFGHMLPIRKPSSISTKSTPPRNVEQSPPKQVITQNVSIHGELAPCTVSVKWMIATTGSTMSKRANDNMRDCPAPKKVTHRTSGRKRTQIDYSVFEADCEPASTPKKRKIIDLK